MPRGYAGGLANVGLRAVGLLLLLVGYLALSILVRKVNAPAVHRRPGVIDIACATIGFIGMSFGSALAGFGGHIFDEVHISRRWSRSTRTFDSADHDAEQGPFTHVQREMD